MSAQANECSPFPGLASGTVHTGGHPGSHPNVAGGASRTDEAPMYSRPSNDLAGAGVMTPALSLICAVAISGIVLCGAWFILSPVYNTNDDVGFRLFLEGRLLPGVDPTGRFYFSNLAFGQVLAALNKLAPQWHWFDAVEQGTLLLASVIALYCCLRQVRHWTDWVFVGFYATVLLTIFESIQYTIVGGLGTTVALAALVFASCRDRPTRECRVLAGAGAVLLALAALFRLEATILATLVVLVTSPRSLALAIRRNVARAKSVVVGFGATAMVFVLAAWAYHFAMYFGPREWSEFYEFNLLWATLVDYAPGRAPPDVLAKAFASVGWTSIEHRLLYFAFFDNAVFSVEKLKHVILQLPPVSGLGAQESLNLAAEYAREYPWFFMATAGLIIGSRPGRTALWALGSAVGVIVLVALISIILKPLPARVFLPLAAGSLFVIWITCRARQYLQIGPIRSAVLALLLITASLLTVSKAVHTSQWAESAYKSAQADLARLPIGERTLVIFGPAFPYELLERPFAAPYLQRMLKAVPLGTTLRAPPFGQYFRAMALPDFPSWLCSDAVLITATDDIFDALRGYYARYRGEVISLTRVFQGSRINAQECRVVR